MAPGLKLSAAELNQIRHHVMLAHGLSVQAIRAMGKSGTKCGAADVIGVAVPVIETPEHITAAERATRQLNAPFATVMLTRLCLRPTSMFPLVGGRIDRWS
jgi:beta-glucosidase